MAAGPPRSPATDQVLTSEPRPRLMAGAACFMPSQTLHVHGHHLVEAVRILGERGDGPFHPSVVEEEVDTGQGVHGCRLVAIDLGVALTPCWWEIRWESRALSPFVLAGVPNIRASSPAPLPTASPGDNPRRGN